MNHIFIKKGHDIKINGVPTDEVSTHYQPKSVAIIPKSFRDVKPKLMVKEGDTVQIGSPVFFDKTKPEVKWASPANGIISSIQFGARRVLEKIEISVKGQDALSGKIFSIEELASTTRDIIINRLLDSNIFPLIRQRPFNKVANPKDEPRDIFVSAINTAPLSVNLEKIIEGEKEAFQAGITALSKLTSGDIYVTSQKKIDLRDAKVQTISGPHPAGNVGIQIHHTKPLKPHDLIWTVNTQHVITIGKLFLTGSYQPNIIITIGGPGATKHQTLSVNIGTSIGSLIADQKLSDPIRIISGDVLTGNECKEDDFLGYYDSSITILSDVIDRPFLGMLAIGSNKTKYSLTNAFLNFGKQLFNFNTSQNGEERAIVPINAWENVLPMNIYPNALYRSILAQDIEEMENLGIWECDDEDFALCSFACPSKIDVGAVIRDGLDLLEADA